jgi:hypothetical protein
MTWILIAYLLGLFYFTANQDKLNDRFAFRKAWSWLGVYAASHFVFTLFRAGNMRDVRDLQLIEVWSTGVGWLIFGVSIYHFAEAAIGRPEPNSQ